MPNPAFIFWPCTSKNEYDGYLVVDFAYGTSGVQAELRVLRHIRETSGNISWHISSRIPRLCGGGSRLYQSGCLRQCSWQPYHTRVLRKSEGTNDVVYSVEAAQEAFLELLIHFIRMDHSQGAGITWSIAQRQVLLSIRGHLATVAIAPVTKYLLLRQILGASFTLQYTFLLVTQAVRSLFPTFDTVDVLTTAGQ